MRDNSKTDIIELFIQKSLVFSNEPDHSINENDMIVLWKRFCDDILYGINYFIKHEDFINDLKSRIKYDNNYHVFQNVSSKFIPQIKSFVTFWKKHFYYDESELFLEINEIQAIYCQSNDKKASKVSDDSIIQMLKNYVDDIIIIDEKYVQNYGCTLWNKRKQIDIALKNMNIESINQNMNIHKIYSDYCDNNDLKYEMNVRKKYFEYYIETHAK